jgi:hypothetical protein
MAFSRSENNTVLSAFACWLTFLASADDFNLARLALPVPAADSEEALPLDDPNSDFTESSPSREPTPTSRDRLVCKTSAGRRSAGATPASALAAPAHGHPPRCRMNAPLRC